METALHLAQKGKNVTVLEMKDIAAAEARRGHYYNMFMDAVREYEDNLKILLQVVCIGISEGGVTYKDADGAEHTLAAGTVLLATGLRADVSGAEKYMNCGKQFYIIGDCGQMGNLQTAIRSAWSVANTL